MNLSKFDANIDGQAISLYFRANSYADAAVVAKVFNANEYEIEQWQQGKCLVRYCTAEIEKGKAPLIIDAGANIGASASYFAAKYPGSLVCAVEPEKNNFTVLRLNSQGLNIIPIEAAVGSEDGEMYLHDPGEGDWGFRVLDKGGEGEYLVSVLTPLSLFERFDEKLYFPLIFKIDIEGGEDNLFSSNVAWIDKIPLLVIELHDGMLPFSGSSRNFIKAISNCDFDILHKGENMFFFNRRILNEYDFVLG